MKNTCVINSIDELRELVWTKCDQFMDYPEDVDNVFLCILDGDDRPEFGTCWSVYLRKKMNELDLPNIV